MQVDEVERAGEVRDAVRNLVFQAAGRGEPLAFVGHSPVARREEFAVDLPIQAVNNAAGFAVVVVNTRHV